MLAVSILNLLNSNLVSQNLEQSMKNLSAVFMNNQTALRQATFQKSREAACKCQVFDRIAMFIKFMRHTKMQIVLIQKMQTTLICGPAADLGGVGGGRPTPPLSPENRRIISSLSCRPHAANLLPQLIPQSPICREGRRKTDSNLGCLLLQFGLPFTH